jgi:hypothetical protein
MDLREIGFGVWIGSGWLRTGTGGGLLWVRWWTFGFLRHGVSQLVSYLVFWVLTPCWLVGAYQRSGGTYWLHLCWWSSCRWGDTTSLNCGHQWTYCLSPRWYMSMENRGGIMLKEEDTWFIHQNSLSILPADSCVRKQQERAKGRKIYPCEIFFSYLQVIFTWRHILRHGASSFTPPPNEGVMQISIALNNPSSLSTLNLQTL